VKSSFARGSQDLEIYVTGNGFLYNMVRTLVGTMLSYSAGRLSDEKLKNTLELCDRESVGKTMPAKGLTLESVEYNVKLF
jgi:tRNA pseudouridine38-40 synthase